MNNLEQFRTEKAHDPAAAYRAPPAPPKPVKSQETVTAEERERILKQLEAWFIEARDAAADNRAQMMIDYDFYDHDQYDEETRQILEARGQAPLTFNLAAGVVNWLTGTEARTRIDWKILPRGSEDRDAAEAKTALFKYYSDVNLAPFVRSESFKQAVIGGVGWIEEFRPGDAEEEEIGYRGVDWKYVWWDPAWRSKVMKDCRYLYKVKWLDLDYAQAAFPKHAEALRIASVEYTDTQFEGMDEDWDLPAVFQHRTRDGRTYRGGSALGSSSPNRGARRRVRMVETQFKRPTTVQKIHAPDHDAIDGRLFDPADTEMARMVREGACSLTDRVSDRMWSAIWVPGTLCELKRATYRHGGFSLTPIWYMRRHRDGMPYGVMRGLRDAQEEYNKRRSKALFVLSTNQVIAEDGAIAKDDEDDVLQEVAKPNGYVKLAKGALSEKKFQIRSNIELGVAQVTLMEECKTFINEGSGVTRENLGLESGAVSGRAILAKQQQGATSTAELFDNLRLATLVSGRKILSLMEQYVTLPKKIRILGQEGKPEFLTVNEPLIDPASGEVFFSNDIAKGEADFVVAEQDYRETVRMAMFESLLETLPRLPADLQPMMLDLVFSLSDLPNRDELVARIRQHTGVGDEAAAAAAKQAAAEAAAAELDKVKSDAEKNRATAQKALADARRTNLESRGAALETAGMAIAMPELAPAGDTLYDNN